jgi:phage FluMu gp28-like protein
MKQRFVLGVDLGQAHDYTALVVLERAENELHARHIERLPLGTSYPNQVERIVALVGSPQLARDVLVAVDGTGVGRAVVDLLREALRVVCAPVTAITITGGSTASHVGSKWSIPKKDLVGAAQVALQTRKLKIASALPTAQLLADELAAYRVTLSEDGRDSYGNGREAQNDDLVLALAIAAYVATQYRRRSRITHVGLEPPLATGNRFVPNYVIPHDIFK